MDLNRSHKQRLFKRKFLTGFACHKGEKARMFVLTESDEAIARGYIFIMKCKKLVAMLRKKFGKFDYCCVVHLQGDKKRMNYHLTYFGSFIDQKIIEDWWSANYDSHRSKMELIKYPEKQAKYLAGYMGREEKFISAHFSSWWTFPGCWEFCKWVKHEFLAYPPEEMLIKYAHLTKDQLENELWYALFLDYKIKIGKMKPKVNKPGPKSKKQPLYERVFRTGEYEILSVGKN